MKKLSFALILSILAFTLLAQSYPSGGSIGSLTVASNQILTIGAGQTLNVSGSLIVNGSINAPDATINLTGTASLQLTNAGTNSLKTLKTNGTNTISGSGLATFNLQYLEIASGAGTTTISSELQVTEGLKVNSGTLAGTGPIHLNDAPINYLAGTITIPVLSSWVWANHGVYCDNDWHYIATPGSSNRITNNQNPGVGNFYWYESTLPGGQSAFTWNESTSSWQYCSSLTKGTGATAYSFLNCPQGNANANKITATLPTGATNEFSFPAVTRNSANLGLKGWNLMGNPYPAFLDWSGASASGWTRSLITSLAIYDPSTGGFVYASGNGLTIDPGYNGSIKPYQGFFVRTNFNNYTMKVNRAAIVDEAASGNPYSQPATAKYIQITGAGGTSSAYVFAASVYDNQPGQSDAEWIPTDTKVKATTGEEFSCPEPTDYRFKLNGVDPCEGDGQVDINEITHDAVKIPVFIATTSGSYTISHSYKVDDYLVYYIPDGASWDPNTQQILPGKAIKPNTSGQTFGDWVFTGCLVIACPQQ